MADLLENLPHILIRSHLGLGDMLVANAILRHYAKSYNVFAPCKRHNALTVNFMLRDIRNLEILPIENDAEADEFCGIVSKEGHRVLKLGMFGQPPYSPLSWDRDCYRQAGLRFEDRWNFFGCHRQPSRELPVPEGPFCFIHEDQPRGYSIDRSRLPKDLPWVFAEPGKTQNLFDWWGHIEHATELHLVDSCFAIMADSLPDLKARRVVIHVDARPGAQPPHYVKATWAKSVWQVIR